MSVEPLAYLALERDLQEIEEMLWEGLLREARLMGTAWKEITVQRGPDPGRIHFIGYVWGKNGAWLHKYEIDYPSSREEVEAVWEEVRRSFPREDGAAHP